MTDIDYNALGQAIDTTWGRSSTPKTSSYSVKVTMMGPDRILVSYAAIVNFATERQMIEMKRRYEDESKSITDAALKVVKKNYKELSGDALTAKELSATESLEMIGMNMPQHVRSAYFRRKTVYEIG